MAETTNTEAVKEVAANTGSSFGSKLLWAVVGFILGVVVCWAIVAGTLVNSVNDLSNQVNQIQQQIESNQEAPAEQAQ